MKFTSFLTLAFYATTAFSAPFAANAVEGPDLSKRVNGGGSIVLRALPKSGITGVFYDDAAKVTKVYFGDEVKTHGAHIKAHEKQFPSHAGKVYKLAGGKSRSDPGSEFEDNAKEALGDLKGVPRNGKVFDEKPWASLSRNFDSKVSVVKVPDAESRIEGSLSSNAKRIHLQNPSSRGIQLIDNRTVKSDLDKSLILKGLKRRGVVSSVSGDLSDITSSIGDDLDNSTLIADLEKDWSSISTKMASLLDPIVKEVEWVGDNFVGFLEQEAFPSSHQLGVAWHGFTMMDDLWTSDNSSYTSNTTNLATDYAAMMLYTEAANNASSILGKYQDLIGDNVGVSNNVTASSR